MKWFKHHTDSHDNNKLTKVRMKYGAEGYAIYWYCLELIAGDLGESKEINFELKHDSEVIGFNLKIDSRRVEDIMRYMVELNLFEEIEGRVTCFKLAKYLEKKTTRNQTIHRIIDAASVPRLSPDKHAFVPRQFPDCPETSPLDTDTDTDKRKEAKASSSTLDVSTRVPYQKIVDIYHESLPMLPRCQALSKTRKGQIAARFKNAEHLPDIEHWRSYFEWVSKSDFLTGKKDPTGDRKRFVADIEWLTKEGNFLKVWEGKYHGI